MLSWYSFHINSKTFYPQVTTWQQCTCHSVTVYRLLLGWVQQFLYHRLSTTNPQLPSVTAMSRYDILWQIDSQNNHKEYLSKEFFPADLFHWFLMKIKYTVPQNSGGIFCPVL